MTLKEKKCCKCVHTRVIGISHYFPRRLKAFLLVLGDIIFQFFRSGRHRDCILQSRSRPEIFGIAFLNPDPVPSEKNASGSGSRSGYPDFGIKGADPWADLTTSKVALLYTVSYSDYSPMSILVAFLHAFAVSSWKVAWCAAKCLNVSAKSSTRHLLNF